MIYKTRDFGEREIPDSKVIIFKQPIFGFDDYKRYTLIFDEEIGEQIVWLQSLEEPGLCFLLFNPSQFEDFYKPEITEENEKLLGSGEYACWTVLSLKEDFEASTVNLKSPVVINSTTGVAAQILLEQDYPVRHPIMEGAK
ncbi:MAG: flagellar assembly protein FliW [Clostridia bacterium]|nr:flagellar assembly protein FliW [Clostridia bacterium]MBR3809439.1 flagellar assembly protein FliW [Clostridia bacterium]